MKTYLWVVGSLLALQGAFLVWQWYLILHR
jgi:hypothetical protein